MARDSIDFTIDKIHTAVFISTDKNWHLNSLSYDDWYVLCYSVAGKAVYLMDDKKVDIDKGTVLFIPPKKSRTAYTDIDDLWKFIVIKFSIKSFSEGAKDFLDRMPSIWDNINPSAIQAFKDIESSWRVRDDGFALKCKGLIYSILFQLISVYSSENAIHDRYKEVIEYVTSMIMKNIDKNFSSEELAKMANLSPSYFRTVFKRFTGLSPIQYQINYKMHYAYDLLCSQFYMVSEVAKIIGIHDEYYFSRLFRKVMGFPPSAVLGKSCRIRKE